MDCTNLNTTAYHCSHDFIRLLDAAVKSESVNNASLSLSKQQELTQHYQRLHAERMRDMSLSHKSVAIASIDSLHDLPGYAIA